MKIFEVKNNLIKLFYNDEDNLFLSSFIIIKDTRESYIAQIMHLESSKHGNLAIAKLIFNISEEGVITTYNGSVPVINSALKSINSADFLRLIQGQNPIIIGKLSNQNTVVSLDKSLLENKLVICSENQETSDLMIKILHKQIKNYNKKVLIIDAEGYISSDSEKIVAGENFKIPISPDTINYIFNYGIDYKNTEAKAVVQEIFLDLQYYIKSLEEQYLPISNFIDVLDNQYKDSKIPELILIKNALLKYAENGIFAQNKKDFDVVRNSLLENQITVVDLSNIEEGMQREFISFVYSALDYFDDDFYVFIKATNQNTNKKLLKKIFFKEKAKTVTICNYAYKYLEELKKIAKDMILFTPLLKQQDFASYNTFLSTLSKNEFIVYGKSTQYVPLIVKPDINSTSIKNNIKSEEISEMNLFKEQIKELMESQAREQREKEQEELRRKAEFEEEKRQQQQMLKKMQEQLQYQQQLHQQHLQQQQIQQQEYYRQMQMPYMMPYMMPMQPMMPQMPYIQQPQIVMPQTPINPNISSNMQLQTPSNPEIDKLYSKMPNNDFFKTETMKAGKETRVEKIKEIKMPTLSSIEPQSMPIEEDSYKTSFDNFEAKTEPTKNPQEVFAESIAEQNSVVRENFENIQLEEDLVAKEQKIEQSQSYLESQQASQPQNIEVEDLESQSQDEALKEQIQSQSLQEAIEKTGFTEADLDNIQNVDLYNDVNDNVVESDYHSDIEDMYNASFDGATSFAKTPEVVEYEEPANAIPIYTAPTGELAEEASNIDLDKDDIVIHEAYGQGKIEKVINYGSKKLCSIYFETVGRKLLDPTISGLKKVN